MEAPFAGRAGCAAKPMSGQPVEAKERKRASGRAALANGGRACGWLVACALGCQASAPARRERPAAKINRSLVAPHSAAPNV